MRVASFPLATLALLGGCMTSGLYETARCAPPGEVEHTVTLQYVDSIAGLADQRDWWPAPQYTVRVGIFRNCDIGLRLGLLSAGLSAKYTFYDGTPSIALLADGAAMGWVHPMVGGGAGTALGGRLVASDEVGTLGYAASLGAERCWERNTAEGGLDIDQWWSVTASAGMPWSIGERVRVMPVVGAALPVWARRRSWEWLPGEGDSTEVYTGIDPDRLSLSLGVSVSIKPEP